MLPLVAGNIPVGIARGLNQHFFAEGSGFQDTKLDPPTVGVTF